MTVVGPREDAFGRRLEKSRERLARFLIGSGTSFSRAGPAEPARAAHPIPGRLLNQVSEDVLRADRRGLAFPEAGDDYAKDPVAAAPYLVAHSTSNDA